VIFAIPILTQPATAWFTGRSAFPDGYLDWFEHDGSFGTSARRRV